MNEQEYIQTYGNFSQPGIPGGSTLIFEIELFGIAWDDFRGLTTDGLIYLTADFAD